MAAKNHHSILNRLFMLVLLLSLFGSTLQGGVVSAANAEKDTPPPTTDSANTTLTAPEVLVNTTGVSDFYRVGTVVYWHTVGDCYTPPAIVAGAADPAVPNATNLADVPEATLRLSLIGSTQQRKLYSKDIRATNNCAPYGFSRVVGDDNYAYWVDATGLVKLSRNANLGDVPTVVSATFNDKLPYEIAIGGNYIFLSRAAPTCTGICIIDYPIMKMVDKSTGAVTGLDCSLNGCPYGHNMKADPNGRYLYYLNSSNTLYRKTLDNSSATISIATNVTAYYPEGRFATNIFFGTFSDKLFYAKGKQIFSRDYENSTTTAIYTSNSITPVSINELISDRSSLFFFEVREEYCPSCLIHTYTGWLFRALRTSSVGSNIYQTTPGVYSTIDTTFGLVSDNVKLYWLDGKNIIRLSDQATALPKSPMQVTGIEVVQSVQTLTNSVALIQGKRTFARVYVKSTDSSRDVPGVTARLQAFWLGASAWSDWIEPTNISSITVKRNPKRIHLNDGFLFELPWAWINSFNLVLKVELNPAHNPEESDGYANNIVTSKTFILNPSPRLEIRLFDYSYSMAGTTFAPDPSEDQGNIDWITNAYPVSDSSYGFYGSGTGLVWESFPVMDDALADLVRYPSYPCEDKDTNKNPNDNLPDCENLRASEYVSSQIGGMRGGLENAQHDTDNTSYYGLIPPGKEMRGYPSKEVTYFPRGLDSDKDASGPAGAKWLGWYAGHEVGHSLGLGHPGTAGNTNECGIKGGDSYPTYAHAKIGTSDNTTSVMGFWDKPAATYPRYDDTNLYLSSGTYDMMAYCLPQWISDENYTRIFQSLTGYTPVSLPTKAQSTQSAGDWLAVYGGIYDSKNKATMDYLEHKTGTVTIPPIVAGPYAIRLLNSGGSTLVDYAFTPTTTDDSPVKLYGQVVALVAGTSKVQIVRLSDQVVMAEHAVGSSNPSVSNVVIVNKVEPVKGSITLSWSASHPDNLPLTFKHPLQQR